ncbi:polysaccharide lyase family 14 protein [Infundibulicybe gibba]|nr:polysaccharide lyase family 14 protein [Infundibulicybe gibba]
MRTSTTLLTLAIIYTCQVVALQATPESLATQFSLTTSTALPFPSATQASSDAQSLMVSEWSLAQGRIQDGSSNLAFINDPFPTKPAPGSQSNATGPVLQVTYPAGSYSHDTGGTQWYSLFNTTGEAFGSMMVSYEVAFDAGYDWVKGGKLPGLRGGLNQTGCSGGNEANGVDCFSTRLMWRQNGAGEAYAYIPTPNNLCSQKSIICNSDFGISISRGAFSIISGQWNRITMLAQLNNPPRLRMGTCRCCYFNDQQVISQSNLQFRKSSSLAVNGLYFSTFFGGSDPSWSTPTTQHTYFRNLRLWAGSSPSNSTGQPAKNAAKIRTTGIFSTTIVLFITLLSVVIP